MVSSVIQIEKFVSEMPDNPTNFSIITLGSFRF